MVFTYHNSPLSCSLAAALTAVHTASSRTYRTLPLTGLVGEACWTPGGAGLMRAVGEACSGKTPGSGAGAGNFTSPPGIAASFWNLPLRWFRAEQGATVGGGSDLTSPPLACIQRLHATAAKERYARCNEPIPPQTPPFPSTVKGVGGSFLGLADLLRGSGAGPGEYRKTPDDSTPRVSGPVLPISVRRSG